ncbi:MAG: hypothetical protein AAGF66_03170 [Cyanobacteria bacterium P01_H01_bin.119]
MFTVEVMLERTPLPLSVQKKEEDAAIALYQQLVDALGSDAQGTIEMICDQQPGKKVSLRPSQIAAVQIYEKSGTAAASGRPPGFFSMATPPS